MATKISTVQPAQKELAECLRQRAVPQAQTKACKAPHGTVDSCHCVTRLFPVFMDTPARQRRTWALPGSRVFIADNLTPVPCPVPPLCKVTRTEGPRGANRVHQLRIDTWMVSRCCHEARVTCFDGPEDKSHTGSSGTA